MTPQRVTLITLGCADLARSRAFYAALGWREAPGGTEGVSFYQMHGAALALFGRDDLAADPALKPPEAVFWGGYSGYWADPDGHVWEVAHNPFWPLAEDGSLTLPGAS